MRVTTLLIVLAVVLALAYFIWQLVNSKLAGKARRPHSEKRKSDTVRLSKADKVAYKQAEKLYLEGNFRGCAKILESLGLIREAVTILEKAGHVREACDTLIRIQRPNRAGYLLARHGMFKEALECFKKANLPLEVARCARELGDLPTAIPYFLEAKGFLEAAECYLEIGKHHEAARLFLKIKEFDRALDQYIHFVDNYTDIERVAFTEEELDFIMKKLIENRVDTRLADILIAKKRSTPLLIELIKTNNLRSATAALMRSTSDIGPELIAFKDFSREQNIILGALFMNVGSYEYSGMVFERLEEFERAGEAFEKGEFFDRAAYCFERAKNKAKSTEMRIMAASHGSSGVPTKSPRPATAPPEGPLEAAAKVAPNPFSIQDTSTDAIKPSTPPNLKLPPKAALKSQKAAASAVPSPQVAYLGEAKDEKFQVANPNVNWDPFFQAEFLVDLSTHEQKLLQEICYIREFQREAVVLDYNHTPAGIYFVLSGTIVVYKRDRSGNDVAGDELQTSDTFGELWLLRDQPTTVKFSARSNCLLGCIKRADFEHLMDENGAIARKLYKRYAQKLFGKLIDEQNRLRKRSAS